MLAWVGGMDGTHRADTLSQLLEGGVPGEVRADGDSGQEGANEALGLGPVAASVGRPHAQVLGAPAVPGQQQLEGG